MRLLGVLHIAIAILLLPLTVFPLPLMPIMLIGPVWAIVLGVRMWKRRDVVTALRRTHWVFLAIDAAVILYGVWMVQAAEASARRGGGLLGGLGFVAIIIGVCLAVFSILTLVFVQRARVGHP